MERIDYSFPERDALFAQLAGAGKVVAEDVTINLDKGGVPQTCFCITEDAPLPPDTESADMQAALTTLGVTPEG